MKNTLILLITVLSVACSDEKENAEKYTTENKNELAELTDPANQTLDELGASVIYLLKNNN
ncbi:MAG: hypothetical protein AB1458_13475, partial [Bacteroidota bacterium]